MKKNDAGPRAQGTETVTISARVPPELRRRLKRYLADHDDLTAQAVLIDALDEYLKKRTGA